jgi:hypothetical protein
MRRRRTTGHYDARLDDNGGIAGGCTHHVVLDDHRSPVLNCGISRLARMDPASGQAGNGF